MKSSRKSEKMVAARESAVRALVSGSSELVRRLARLNGEDRANVLSLLMVTEVLGSYTRSQARLNRKAIVPFLRSITDLSPALARRLSVLDMILACRKQIIATATCMGGCRKEGKSEADCERLCSPELAAEIGCMMKQFDALRVTIPKIIRDPFPPPPPPVR